MAAAVGAGLVTASLAGVVAVEALIGIGTSIVMPVLVTLIASATALEVCLKYSYRDSFKIGTCLGSIAAAVGGLTLAFNSILPKAPERPKTTHSQPVILEQVFKKSAAAKNFDAAPFHKITRPGTPATAFPSAG